MAKAADRETRGQASKAAAEPPPVSDVQKLARVLRMKPQQLETLGRRAAMGGRIAGMPVSDAVSLVRALVFKFGQSVGADDLLEPGAWR